MRFKRKSYDCRTNENRQRKRNRRAGYVCLICDKGGIKDVEIYEEINTFLIKDMLETPSDIIQSLGENVYKVVWLCSKCKLLVEDARTIHNEEGTMMMDDEGVSQLHNNFHVLREQISEMMRKSWKHSITKETMKNLTITLRTILVRSLFEEEDMDVKPDLNLLEGGGGSQGQPEKKKQKAKNVKEKVSPKNKKVLNYFGTKSEEGEGQTYTCTTCSYATSDLKIMKAHQKQHQYRNVKSKVCPQCGKSFKALEQHIRIVHNKEHHFCPLCDQHFPTINERTIHVNSVHKGLPIYECPHPDCRKAFGQKNQFKKHQLTHTDEKPFICERCLKGFRSKGALKIHGGSSCNDDPEEREKIRAILRKNKKWWKCDHCDFKTYGVKAQLRRHVENKHPIINFVESTAALASSSRSFCS